METLPDLLPLSDDELSALLAQLEDPRGCDLAPPPRPARSHRHPQGRADRAAEGAGSGGELRGQRATSLERPLYEGTGDLPAEDELAPLPDLSSLDDAALWAEIRSLEQEEDDISLNRRVMHAQIDIIRAERAKRARSGEHVDPDDLGPILGGGQ